MIQSQIYPWKPSKNVVEVYDKIATKLHTIITEVANKLNIESSDIRASLDGLWCKDDKKGGLAIQIKSKDNTWDKPWAGNNLIIQTPNNEGVVITTNKFTDIDLKGPWYLNDEKNDIIYDVFSRLKTGFNRRERKQR